MKLLIALVVGLVLGVVGHMAYENPDNVARQAHKLINDGEVKVKDAKREQCQKTYLEETSCFQDTKKKPDDCVKDMETVCGKAPK